MVVELVKGSNRVPQNAKFHIAKGVYFRSSKPRPCKGKWYYEATHYSGGSNYHLIGFYMGAMFVSFYPQSNPNKPNFFDKNGFSRIPFPVSDEHTVGIGVDADAKIFYIFYNNSYAYHDFKSNVSCTLINPQIWGADIDITDDNVSANLGDTPFKYNIPGFTAWSKTPERPTFKCKNRNIRTSFIAVLLFAIEL